MSPRRPLFISVAALALLGLLAVFGPAAAAIWPFAALALGLVLLADAALGLAGPVPSVQRDVPRSMSLATWVDVRLTVRNDSASRALRLRVFDHFPQPFAARGLPYELGVAPGRFAELSYSLRPTERGPFTFPGIELLVASPLGFWWRRRRLPAATTVRVYPNYSTIAKLLAYEVDNHLALAGLRLRRRRGEGIEFHQLRDYREGDSLRSIDWKATARVSRLIAREYQDERDQQVLFMLDAGRRMLAKDAELSHFDHTLNAMLLLGYIALRRGDSVGVMTMGASRGWLAPRKGVDAVNGLLNHVYDVQPSPDEIDYVAAATEVAVKQRRRSLVVLLTNVREEDSDEIVAAVSLLRRRHLVIVASLRETALDETLAQEVRGTDDALLHAATNQYLEARRESHNLLRARGVFVEDCLCADLPSAITNRYLAIKRAGML